MNRSNLNVLTAILLAAGAISPAALGSQIQFFAPQPNSTSLVGANYEGIHWGEKYIQGDTLKIVSIEDGEVGITAENKDDFGLAANLCRRDNCTGLKVSIDLGQSAYSVGILLGEGASLNLFQDADIKADTAIQGIGTVFLSYGQPSTYDIVGGLDMKEGSIVSETDNAFHYVGIGDLGTFDAQAGHLVIGETSGQEGGETFLRIGTLQLGAGASVTVAGDKSDDSSLNPINRVLIVRYLEAVDRSPQAPETASDQRTVNVTGEGTLILGSSLADGENIEELQRTVGHVLNSSKVITGSLSRATLITSSNHGIVDGISVVIGEDVSQDKAAEEGIHIGNDGRWIVDFTSEETKSFASDPVSLGVLTGMDQSRITAENDAELILYNWRGQAFDIGDFDPSNVHAFGGARIQIKDNIATRLWCKDFAGLQGSALVGHVEGLADRDKEEGILMQRPGYSFIFDTLPEENVGRDAYSNVVDGAIFLPVTSGIATAAERAVHDAVTTVMTHDLSLFEGRGHWWAHGQSGRIKAGEIFSGGSGDFGFDADVTAGALGYDFAMFGNWITTVAASFAGIDTDSKGVIERTSGDMSVATVSLAAARHFDDFTLRLGLAYSRAAGDAEQRSVGHRLDTDVDIDYLTAVARVTVRSLTEKMLFEPFAQLSVTTAKMHDGSIFDSDRDGAVAGEGFKTTADNRVWGTLEVGADAGWRFDVADLVSVKPQFGVSMRTSVGHTDWEIESRLFDGSASSAASYDSAQRFAVRLQAGIELASNGYSDSKSYFWSRNHEGKTEPYAWTLLLAGSYERASDREQSGSLSLQYRQLF